MTQMEDSEWSVVHVTSMDALLRNETMVLHIALVIGMITCAISLCIARLIATLDFPTPPLPLVTVITLANGLLRGEPALIIFRNCSA